MSRKAVARLLVRSVVNEDTTSYEGWWWVNHKLYRVGMVEHWIWIYSEQGKRIFYLPKLNSLAISQSGNFMGINSVDKRKAFKHVVSKDPIRLAIYNKRTAVAQLPKLGRRWYDELLDAILESGSSKVQKIKVSSWADKPGFSIDLDGQEFLAGNIVKI